MQLLIQGREEGGCLCGLCYRPRLRSLAHDRSTAAAQHGFDGALRQAGAGGDHTPRDSPRKLLQLQMHRGQSQLYVHQSLQFHDIRPR